MSSLGNFLWFVFGFGWWACIVWHLAGFLLSLTIIGIPYGREVFKVAEFATFPFGKELVSSKIVGERPKYITQHRNAIWVVFFGFWVFLSHIFAAITMFCTIIGIPFAIAHFNIAKAALAPFGKVIMETSEAEKAKVEYTREKYEVVLKRNITNSDEYKRYISALKQN